MFKKYSEIKELFSKTGRSLSDAMSLYDEPTYLGFKVLFHFNDKYSPLLNRDTDHCAYNYLINNGYNKRAKYLFNFIEQLQKISRESEWYFQSLSGLESIVGMDIHTTKINDTGILEIDMLEGLDLRVTGLLDNYYRACFDHNNRKEIVPRNLRQFAMSIYIADVREFYSEYKIEVNGKVETKEASIDLENNINRSSIFIRLDMCEFDKISRINFLSGVNNSDLSQATQKMSINHRGMMREYPYYVLDTEVNSDDIINSPQNTLNQRVEPTFGEIVSNRLNLDRNRELLNNLSDSESRNQLISDGITNIANQAKNKIGEFGRRSILNSINDVEVFARGQINSVILGNVYDSGGTIRNVRDILNTGISISDF